MRLALAALLLFPAIAGAQDHAAIARRAVEAHILPGYARLTAETAALDATAEAVCAAAADRPALDAAYHAAFDAWIAVSHLRFGPSEAGDRAFAIAFWPDARGFTPRALEGLIRDADPTVDDPAAFAEVSVAARGLFALDYLLFDPERGGLDGPEAGYRCRLLTAIAHDLAANAAAIEADWRADYADLLLNPGPGNPVYASGEETTRALFGALATGLEATIELRLGRPLGTFERPRPRRAEAWRSGRPLRNVALSVAALADFAETAFLPEIAPDSAEAVRSAFHRARVVAERAPAPMVEAVADPGRRIGVEAAQSALRRARDAVSQRIGVALGVTLGFNSLDGD